MSEALPRPTAGEYAAFYAGYVAGVPEGDLLATLEHQLDDALVQFGAIGEEHGDHAYAEGKWSIKQVILHVTDAERIFAYRALRIARGDETPLPGFEENAFAANSLAETRTVRDLAEEFGHVRRATLALLRPLTAEAGARRGTASGKGVTVRALAWILAGHAAHHLRILRERYI